MQVSSPARRSVFGALPFELTATQHEAFDEILSDMQQPRPMNRLLQGDVGSGKTAVAGCSLLLNTMTARQSVLLVPTEILARQQASTLQNWADGLGLSVDCLTAATPRSERSDLLRRATKGEPLLIVGTHALLDPSVRFRKLGLAVIDEQHRFGVRQRAALTENADPEGGAPHLLVMTATPIPRSLTLTLYGDLDVSVIRGRPTAGSAIRTEIRGPGDWPPIRRRIADHVRAGGRVYVVSPRVESSGNEPTSAAVLRQRLAAALPGIAVGLVHGGLEAKAKTRALAEFVVGATPVLVATTVVEVGIDVREASFIVIDHAECFGLAQLHQLRGRVGRGGQSAECTLMAYPPLTETAKRRLRALRDSTDGFHLAEEDLHLRGPGELLGVRQSGDLGLRVGDPFRDHRWLAQARRWALSLSDPEIATRPERDGEVRPVGRPADPETEPCE